MGKRNKEINRYKKMRIKTDIWNNFEDIKNNIEWIIIFNMLGNTISMTTMDIVS